MSFLDAVMPILSASLFQSALSTLLSFACGMPLALVLYHERHTRLARLIRSGLGFFFAFPLFPLILGVIILFDKVGFEAYGLYGILTCHTLLNAPLIALYTLQAFDNVPAHHWRLGAHLPLTPAMRFKALMARPLGIALLQGTVLTFFLCLTSFKAVLFLSQDSANSSLSLALYHALFRRYDVDESVTYIGLILIFSLLKGCLPLGRTGSITHSTRQDLRGKKKTAFSWVTVALWSFLFVWSAPLLVGGLGTLVRADFSFLKETDVITALGGSLYLCSVTGAVSTLMALLWAFLLTTRAHTFARLFLVPLSLPSFVVGAFVFIFAHRYFDLDAWSFWVIVCLQLLAALPFLTRLMTPRLGAIRRDTRRKVALLGLTQTQTFLLILLPQMKDLLFMAFGIGAALCLGDLGTICLFGRDLSCLTTLIQIRMEAFNLEEALVLSYLLGLMAFFFCAAPLIFKKLRSLYVLRP